MSEAFDAPRLAINRVVTKRGDTGETSLAGGQRVIKSDLRIEAYGTIDELNSFIGVARESVWEMTPKFPLLVDLYEILCRVQHELFNAGSILATQPEDIHPNQARVTAEDSLQLEREIDMMNESLDPLRSFVLAGGSRLIAELHVCRTVCRRAERICVALAQRTAVDGEILKYLNRLSDALFVFSRWACKQTGAHEALWDPNKGVR